MKVDYKNAIQGIFRMANDPIANGGDYPPFFGVRIKKENVYKEKRPNGEYLIMDTLYWIPSFPEGYQHITCYNEYNIKESHWQSIEEMKEDYYFQRFKLMLILYKNDFYYKQWDHEFWFNPERDENLKIKKI